MSAAWESTDSYVKIGILSEELEHIYSIVTERAVSFVTLFLCAFFVPKRETNTQLALLLRLELNACIRGRTKELIVGCFQYAHDYRIYIIRIHSFCLTRNID